MKKKSFGGFSFTIDRPKGYVKTWPQPGGREKSFTYPVDYGYLPRHTGEDGEGLDFFVGDEPDGHLESFQKLRKNDDNKYVLDETKFLVGVTDQERETIYKLYGPEVWHRKRYRDMDELERDLPKFAAKKKARYVDDEKVAFDLGAIRRRISTIPNAMRDAFMGSKPTMLAPMVRRTAPTLPRPVPESYTHRPGAVLGGMLEHHPEPTMLAPMVRQSAPQAIEQWANHRGSGSMIDSMAQRAGQMGYPEAAKARTLGEFRDAFTNRGYTPQEVFAPTDPAMMGRLGVNGRRTVQPEWQTTSKVGEVLARFGLSEKLAASFSDHAVTGGAGALMGLLGGARHPIRATKLNLGALLQPVKTLVEYGGVHGPELTGALAMHAGSMVAPAAMGYGAYRGGKALYNKLNPSEEEMTPKQAALARYGLDKVADIDKKITGEILMADIGKKTAGVKLALTPLALGAMGAGIGAGVGAVHGFRTDDPSQSVEHHVMRGARNALIGAGVGAGVGAGGSAVLNKAAPELVELSRQGPFPNIDPKHPHAPYHQLAQNLYEAWLNPAVRLGMGAYAGKNLAQSYGNMVDDWRLQQYAAQKGKTDAPETPNAANLEAIRARRHMGAYSSSLDRGNG